MALSCCKKRSAPFCKAKLKHDEVVYSLNCLHSFRTDNKLKEHKHICKNHDYCYIEMLKEEIVLKYNHGEESIKVPFIIHTEMESLFEKIDTCHKNPKKLSTAKINKHTVSGYSLLTHCSFDATKKKYDYYRD